jgi:hypothetical protein
MKLTFCQSKGKDRWHIRRAKNGSRPTAAIALCGKAVQWDISLPLTLRRLALCCPDCAVLAAKEHKEIA